LCIIYVGCNVIADFERLDDAFLKDRRLRVPNGVLEPVVRFR
jgi:hypothetical protein